MEKVLFTCKKSAEEIERSKKLLTYILPIFGVMFVISVGIVFYYSDINPLELGLIGILMVVFPVGIFIFMGWYIKANTPIRYEQMPDKQFGYDPQTETFHYQDNKRKIDFKADRIETWYSLTERYGTTDIFMLPNEDPIVLESEFNDEVHSYLNDNKEILSLPRPKRMIFKLRLYER